MDNKPIKQESHQAREEPDHKGHHVGSHKGYTNRRRNNRGIYKNNKVGDDGFKGKHKDLSGYVYTYDASTRADQYEKVTERIAEHLKDKCQFPDDLEKCLLSLKEPNTDEWMPKPGKLTDEQKADPEMVEMRKQIRTEEVKEYMLRKRMFKSDKSKAYTIVLGQCSPALKAKLKGQDTWEDIGSKSDVVMLLKSIKVWMMNQQESSCPTVSTLLTILNMFKMTQLRYETLEDFRTRFESAVEVIEHIGVDFGKCLTKMVNAVLKNGNLTRSNATGGQISAAEKVAYEKFQATAFLRAADKSRYEPVLTHLENHYASGLDQYPANITEAYNRLDNWKRNKGLNETPYNDGITFAQGSAAGSAANKKGINRSRDQCFACGEYGHHAWEKKCGPKAGKPTHETTNAMTQTTDPSSSTSHHGDGQDRDIDDHEYAFCTHASIAQDDADVGHLLSQEGDIRQGIRTASFNRKRASVIPAGSVGLDSMSSIDLFGEKDLLTDIHTVQEYMKVVCNAGAVLVTQMGTLKGYGKVWYHPDAIANILSLSRVQDAFRVTYDSITGNQFVVHRKDGSIRVFKQTEKGLYASKLDDAAQGIALVNTVKENIKSYTKREVKRAQEARRLMAIIGRPSEHQLATILNQRQLANSTVTAQDVINARKIFGPDIGSIKGKTVRRREPHVEIIIRPIPSDIMNRHREVVVCFDVMYVNNIAFLVSISRAIKFCTAEALANRRADTLITGIKRIKAIYSRRGFVVNRAAGDNEFSSIESGLSEIGIILNVVARDEHVPEIERHIRTVKERCRATFNSLPFRRMPARMVTELVYSMTFWLHAFPATDGVSATISPRELVTGIMLDAGKHCVIPFGAYVQTHEEHDSSMKTRTIGAVALRPSGNAQGGHYFMSLQTGRRLVRNHWTEVPMPVDVVKRVEDMAGNRTLNRLVFGDRENTQVQEEEPSDDVAGSGSDQKEEEASEASSRSDDEEVSAEQDVESEPLQERAHVKVEPNFSRPVGWAGADHSEVPLGSHGASGGEVKLEQETLDQEDYEEGQPLEDTTVGEDENPGNNDTDGNDVGNDISKNEHEDTAGAEPTQTVEQEMEQRYGARTTAHNLRSRRKPRFDYRQLCAQVDERAIAPVFNVSHLARWNASIEPLLATVLTQHGVNRGLKLFGKSGESAVQKELEQLHDRGVISPRSGLSLTPSERHEALKYLMFLKEKRDGTIKGRGCADGRKQRGYVTKEEASSPTICTEAVFIIIVIAAKEERDVATMDIPGAFLQTDLDGETIIVKFEGRMAEVLAMIDPSLYRQHVMVEKGKPVLYAELRKVLYGMLQAALRFWQQVTQDLVSLGYTINPYDWCVANKIINGKQHTVGWHVDDFILTHEEPSVNDGLISWFQKKYGKLSPVTVNRGKTHEYLGMTLNFEQPGEVAVTMLDYINKIVDEAPGDWSGTAVTPATGRLFDTDATKPKLEETRAALYHHIVAKLLFLCKRARPDIQLAVGFLCTRVKAPDEDDWKKLCRLVQYLRGSRHFPLTLRADDHRVVKWWVDAAFAVHADYKSQTGGAMSLGAGMVYGASTRQKINTKSSTEAELVAADDLMPQILWTRYFLKEQGYVTRDNLLYQDNQSAMLLEKNGKGSSSKRTRHINIRYFFISDRIQSGEITVRYCPTTQMVGDFFTKPLQGMKFRQFRALVLNLKDDQHETSPT